VCIAKDSLSPEENAQKMRELVEILYPLETWLQLEEHIFTAESRQPHSNNQERVLEKELVQARILTAQGSTVYLLPERGGEGKHPDAIVDGIFVEFKTITGGIRQIEERYKEARKQAENVFLKIDSALSKEDVIRKLEGTILQKSYQEGRILVYFTESTKLYYWDVWDLK
jgi:hypothetical protein